MKKLLILFVALCLCVFCVPAGALAEASYDYENSALVRVLCDGQRNCDGSDFPEIEDCGVYVASKTETENGFEYVLILVSKDGKRVDSDTVAKLGGNALVSEASFNDSYTYRENHAELNASKVFLELYQSTELNIVKAEIVSNHIRNYGLLFSVDQSKFDGGFKAADFEALGGKTLCCGDDWEIYKVNPSPLGPDEISQSGKYFGKFESEEIEFLIAAADKLAKTDGILSVRVARAENPYAQPTDEKWKCTPEGVAEITLSGGTKKYDGTVGYTAKVTGTSQGIAEITATRNETLGSASASCTVVVYKPFDVSANGEIGVDDALLALQNSVKKIELDDRGFAAADADKDGSITVTDALMILQRAVGL